MSEEKNMGNYNKILGGLLAAAVGDAMGAATETRNTQQIKDKFNGLVTDFVDIPNDVFARGCPKGCVTDDFSLAYYTAVAIINNKGVIDETAAKNALLTWSKSPYYFMAGPTTTAAVNRLIGIPEAFNNAFHPTYDNSKASNGSAMKIAPVGWASKGNVKKAVEDAITICKPTHNNNISLSGACAIAAAVSCALIDNVTVEEIIKAALYGAQYGQKFGIQLAGPSVYKRIKLAVAIGEKCKNDMEKAMRELADIIGSGLAAAEAVPTVFGLLTALNADPYKCIVAGVNIGNDTDTIATMAGAISGTMNSYFDQRYLRIIDEVNHFDLPTVAARLEKING